MTSNLLRTPFVTCLAAMIVSVFVVGSANADPNARFDTVVIDAGHGGQDLGASEALVYEKHINLDVARRVERALKELNYKTVMTRTDDTLIPLAQRAEIANRERNAIFVSIHFNSTWKYSVTGIETFYRSSKGKNLADKVQKELIRNIGTRDRGVKTANFVVLKRTRHPAILVEGGFVSNRDERDAMTDPRYRQIVADSIVRGIVACRGRL